MCIYIYISYRFMYMQMRFVFCTHICLCLSICLSIIIYLSMNCCWQGAFRPRRSSFKAFSPRELFLRFFLTGLSFALEGLEEPADVRMPLQETHGLMLTPTCAGSGSPELPHDLDLIPHAALGERHTRSHFREGKAGMGRRRRRRRRRREAHCARGALSELGA